METFFDIFGTIIFGAIFIACIVMGIKGFTKTKESCITKADRIFARSGYITIPIGIIGVAAIVYMWATI